MALAHSFAAAVVLLGSMVASGQATPLLDRAQQAVVTYLTNLADLHCTEDVEQMKLGVNGKPETSLRTQYDYFVLLQGNTDDFQIAESRLEMGKVSQRKAPLLLTNGFSTLLLIFHPYYRTGFEFTLEAPETLGGRPAMRYHFAHIPGSRTPAALALRGREYPLDLEGTAWIDAVTGEPLRIDAHLLRSMSDIGLRSLTAHVEYAAATNLSGHFVVPSMAEVDVETPRQHWRNEHVFRNYKLFSTEATQEPNVKVHETTPTKPAGSIVPDNREKP